MSDEDTDREGEGSKSKKKRVYAPQKFLTKYQDQWPCLRPSKLPNHAFCTVCNYDFDVSHQGATDCRRHVEGKKHFKKVAATDSVPRLNSFFLQSQDLRTIRAETFYTTHLAEHNIPLAVADHAGPLFRKMFPDSEIAKQYGCGRTKTTFMLTTLASHDDQCLTDLMKRSAFSLATDGSTDMDDIKMYPIVVRIFDASVGRVVVMLLKISESRESAGRAIFDLLDGELKQRGTPWSNCISFAADNAAVMQGFGKGVAAFLKAQHPHICLMGCPWHLIHLAAERASRELCVNVEDFLVTIYYYLDKSSKRKSNLHDVQVMCILKILKMASTRWLSLGQCVNRLLQQWDALTVFFENEVNAGKKKEDLSFLQYAKVCCWSC
ncbi:zinc finger MYM-type protein 6-like [Tachysurus ichikawai]